MLSHLDVVTPARQVIVKEEINLNGKFVWLESAPSVFFPNVRGEVYITRNLVDDTFDIEINPLNNQSHNIDTPVVNVDQEELKVGYGSDFVKSNVEPLTKDFRWKIRRGILDNRKFRSIKSLVAGLDDGNLRWREPPQLYRAIMFPTFPDVKQKVQLSFDKVLLVKTVETILLEAYGDGFPLNSKTRLIHNKGLKFRATYFYNMLYFVPRKLSQTDPSPIIFDVYMKNWSGRSTDYDKLFKPGKMKTSSLGKSTLGIYFESDPVEEPPGSYMPMLIGHMRTYDSTYYDYKTKKTHVGLEEGSVEGEIIPYNFRGQYKREVSFGPNAIFNDLHIFMNKDIVSPILDPYDGQVQLQVDNVFLTRAKNLRTIPSKDLKLFKDHAFSLNGLERISVEQDF